MEVGGKNESGSGRSTGTTVRTKPPAIETRKPGPIWSTGWIGLLLWAAAGNLVVLLLVAIGHLDKEAFGFAVLFLVGLALLLRTRRTGWIVPAILALLFLDVEFWMLAATISNLRNHEPLLFILEPMALSTISIAGVVAAIASIVTRQQSAAGRTIAPIVAVAAVAVFVVSLGTSAVIGWGKGQVRGRNDLDISMHNVAYSTTSLKARSSEVTVYVTNEDLFWHTFTIDALGVDVQVPVGSHRRVTFTGLPGTYTFYCRIPAHVAAGMKGTLTIP